MANYLSSYKEAAGEVCATVLIGLFSSAKQGSEMSHKTLSKLDQQLLSCVLVGNRTARNHYSDISSLKRLKHLPIRLLIDFF